MKGEDPIFDFIFRHFSKIWLVMLVGIVLFFVVVTYSAIQVAGEVEDKGLKAVIEEVWEGPTDE